MKSILTGLFLLCTAARAEVPPPTQSTTLTALRTILLCSPSRTHQVPAPGTEAGIIDIPDEDLSIIRDGIQVVPAALGMGFGVAMTPDQDLPDVRMVSYRPGRAQPDTYQTSFTKGVEQVNFFSFDLPRELVTGVWRLEAWDGDRLLYSASFDVVPASTLPDLVAECRAPVS